MHDVCVGDEQDTGDGQEVSCGTRCYATRQGGRRCGG